MMKMKRHMFAIAAITSLVARVCHGYDFMDCVLTLTSSDINTQDGTTNVNVLAITSQADLDALETLVAGCGNINGTAGGWAIDGGGLGKQHRDRQ